MPSNNLADSVESPRSSVESKALTLTQVGLVLAVILYVSQLMILHGIISREQVISDFSGIHWYAIEIFLVTFLAYMVRDKKNILYVPFVALVYYTLHEGFFNVFFLSYHGLVIPPKANTGWFVEIAFSAIVPAVVVILCVFRRGFARSMLRVSSRTWVIASVWAIFLAFNIGWMVSGFQITDDVFNLANYALTNVNPVANSFEVAYNVLFSVAFYATFRFDVLRRRTPA